LTLQEISTTNSIITTVIGYGLDFLLSHFNQDKLFPRKIQTRKSEGKQIEVFSKEEALSHFEKSSYIDCKINGFPSYTEYHGIQRYPPDLIFIDIDRSNFENDKQFENALSKTLKNIKVKLNGAIPTVNNSGNGYHIIQQIECPVILEEIEQFQKYKDIFFLSQEFLRFAEDNLSNGKADPGHHPSFKSCQIRVPNSINGKCLDNREKRLSNNVKVKTIQKWNGIRTPLTREFLEDFRTYLEQKITDQENNNYNYNYKKNNNNQNQCYSHNNRIEWIEIKVLQTPISDYRKLAVGLILAPYLIVIKKLSYEECYKIINEWLLKCDSVSGRRLDFDPKYLINNSLKTSAKKLICPISLYKLKTNYPSLYLLIIEQKKMKQEKKKEEEKT
jgi:Primase X